MNSDKHEKVQHDMREYEAQRSQQIEWMRQLYKECEERGLDVTTTHAYVLDSLELDWMYDQGWSPEYAAEQIHTILGTS